MQLWRRLREGKRSSEDQKCGEVQVSTFSDARQKVLSIGGSHSQF